MRSKIHPTWHFTFACLGIVVGIGLAAAWNGMDAAVWSFVGAALVAVAFWRRFAYLLVIALIGGMLLGLWRGSIDQQALTVYSQVFGQRVVVRGTVSGDLDNNARGQLVMQLRDLKSGGAEIEGQLWVTTKARTDLRRSDQLTVEGKLTSGFGNFAGTIYDAKVSDAVRETPGDVGVTIRDNFSEKVRSSIDAPAADLGVGYLLGQKRALSPELVDALMVTGLTHIVVASGYNLTILVRFTRKIFAKVSKYLAVLSGATLVGVFIAITGNSPSMARAGLVSGLSLWAWYVGRRFHPVTLLALAGALTAWVEPSYVWGNLGWSLSFAAFAGVMIVAPLLQAYFWGTEKPHAIGRLLVETFSAQLATLPIILMAFSQFSVVALFANIIIVPFVPLAMVLTFAAGIAGYIAPSIASIIALPAQVLLDAMIAVIEYCASIPWAQVSLPFTWQMLVIAYVVIAAACVYMRWKTQYSLRLSSIVE